ncbi:hypothetical protein [Pseudomonas svalbardensis]|uniref:hypothetical protein n=1 Tax=Pseudomonas svalbardensis TaxID=3042029 RepID=UPI0024B3960E|nr:hypothetical protein [Pseudomonas sp. PMCC200367]
MRENDRTFHEVDIRLHDMDSIQPVLGAIPPQDLVLKFTDARRFDIGALCYTNRFKFARAVVKFVEPDSLRTDRCTAINNFLSAHVTDYYTESSNLTFYANILKINSMVTWCDKNDFQDLLLAPEQYKEALASYTHHLLMRLDRGEIKQFTASLLQSTALKSGNDFFPNCKVNFYSDIPFISVSGSDKNSTTVPSASKMAEHLTLCDSIFREVTKFLLDFNDFPYRMPMLGEYVWLLPAEYPFVTKKFIDQNKKKISSNIFWDYEKGRLRPLKDCFPLSSQRDDQIIRQHAGAQQLIKDANGDFYHEKRFRLGKLAHDAFVSLFVANSGYSETQTRKIRWNNSYSVESSTTHGFCEIKMRAGGMLVSIHVKKTFIKHFERYLLLRRYLCAGVDCPYLFLGMKCHGYGVRGKLQVDAIKNFNERVVNYVDPDFKGLGYRELRKYKSHYLLSEKHSLATVSAVMQTSQATILTSYSDAEENTAIDEISSMMHRLKNCLDDYTGQKTPAGDCSDNGHASAEIQTPEGYEPNCKSFVGCLFCENFTTHVTPEDIRKLLSMRFVINEYMASCTDHDHFRRVHGQAIEQIDRIIAELLAARPDVADLVNIIRNEINDNFELTPYWERQYERLIKLKVMK